MELEVFSELYQKIQTDPSILLLGQNYFFAETGQDPVWEHLAKHVYPELNLPRRRADYPTLWAEAVKNSSDANVVAERITQASKLIPSYPALKTLLKFRWSLLYTSSVGGADILPLLIEQGCTRVPSEEKTAKPKYMDKSRKWCVELCGSAESPPVLSNKLEQLSFQKQISDRLSWISSTYLEYYGVLVIDGLDPEYDWVNNDLFEQLVDLPPKSIYWFSAPEKLDEIATALVERGTLTVDCDSLCAHILRHMPELMEESESEDRDDTDNTLFTTLTLFQDSRQTRTIRIRRSAITDVTGESLCLIDDDSLQGGSGTGDRPRQFADFLMQERLPQWGLFGLKDPFYIPRDKDKDLEKEVNAALNDNGDTRKPVLLCGPSNSGKSMTIANLALRYAKKRRHPVIYIRGELLHGADNRLKDFISHWFCNTELFGGERPARTIVFWDGGGLKCTEQDYANLQRVLFNCNAQVVGTLYAASTPSARTVQLQQTLSKAELKELRKIISSLGGSYLERFDAIQHNQHSAKYERLKNSSLLYLLQTLFKFEFDSEYRTLRDLLERQFNQEKNYAETQTGQSLEEYVEEFFQAQRMRAKSGIASSFQEQLQLILDKMAVEKQDETQDEDEKTRRLNMLKHLADCIKKINSYLAVASEFGVQLPLSLLLKVLKSQNGISYIQYGDEAGKIVDILRADTLVDFVYKSDFSFGETYYVSFRNPIEAEDYICLQCDLKLNDRSDKRKEYEKAKMLEIIALAENDVERWQTNELVRQFGPNGHGKLSELEDTQARADYREFEAYWMEIAQTLIDSFPDEPESVILYAHLTREFICLQKEEHQAYYEDAYTDARTRLISILKKIDDRQLIPSETQYDRLSIELCANYQQSLQSEFNIVSYKDIKARIHRTFLRDKKRGGASRNLSSNSMLDILLNAYQAYRGAVRSGQLPDTDLSIELADILSDITDMLNFDQLVYERGNQALISKIQGIYNELEDGSHLLSQLERQLERKGSDVFLYLQASLLWQRKVSLPENTGSDPKQKLFAANRYAAISHDFLYTRSELSREFWTQVQEDAGQVVAFFEREENRAKIQRSRSSRCIAMLIRAKWVLKTGLPVLATKQRPPMTRAEWDEIYDLCQQYITYYTSGDQNWETFIPAYFLSGIYQWVYGDVREAKEFFKEAKDRCDNHDRSIDRLILCAEGTDNPREFSVRIQRNESKKYTAEILGEQRPAQTVEDRVLGRYGIGVTETVLRMLFDGALPREQQQKAPHPAEIRFNLIGAQLGPAQSGGMSHDR